MAQESTALTDNEHGSRHQSMMTPIVLGSHVHHLHWIEATAFLILETQDYPPSRIDERILTGWSLQSRNPF